MRRTCALNKSQKPHFFLCKAIQDSHMLTTYTQFLKIKIIYNGGYKTLGMYIIKIW